MKTRKYYDLSEELQNRIIEDRKNGYVNPYRTKDEDAIRRKQDWDRNKLLRPAYVRDCEKIMHTPYYNRYADKTQVFSFYKNDDISRRALHVQLVSRIARNIGTLLGLNVDLIEAIALGHDIGHTPFGHAGERALNSICSEGFHHAKQSLRVVELLEKQGKGLNLTKEVRDGIVNHQTQGKPSTLEGKIVQLSDKMAYVNHDIDDAIRGKIIREEELPREYTRILGNSVRSRLNFMIHDIIQNSRDKDDIVMSEETKQAIYGLRKFMFQAVYTNPKAKGEEHKAEEMVENLYDYYLNHAELLPEMFQKMILEGKHSRERVTCDYIAGMTDRYAISKYKEIHIPVFWNVY